MRGGIKELADDAEHLVNILERKAEEEWNYEYQRRRIEIARQELDAMKAEIARSRTAILWALGEGPDSDGKWFGDRIPNIGLGLVLRPYWWRKHLRELAGIDEDNGP